MKTLRYVSFLLVLLGSTAATLPPTPRAAKAAPATTHQWLARYHHFTNAELPAWLAWLQASGPFTQPAPGLLPKQPRSAPATPWAAEPRLAAPE